IRQGPASSAESWFGAATIFTSLFFGADIGFLATGACALFLAAIGASMSAGALSWKADIAWYISCSLESVGLCALSCFAVSRLLATFRDSEKNIDRLGAELRRRRIELERETAGRIDAEGRAEFLANFDEISGLPNEQRFMEILERYLAIARARGRISAVMALGIDRFMRVRETRGAGPSDAILREAAERLRRSFREDDFVARLGWDGFIVLLSDVKEHEDLSGIIKKARMAFDRSFRVEGADIGLSASLGIALFPHDGTEAEMLVRASEAAKHQAMEDGPGSYRLYDAAMHQRLLEGLRLEQEMNEAIRACSFEPWFQPKVDRSGRIVGAEALARWNLRDGRIRLPADFIQAAERTGRIDDIGRIVLSKTCERAASWERKGLPMVPVSVNLSPFQFKSDLLVREIRAILADARLSPDRLDLEITESGIMEDPASAI
ncbi:MAG: EAL domain-containing protein, partial [Spirochaetaceae bacterium]|nr:EAL domain-containing protein [Spirochaetaceae bacterium]